jgi:ribonuclease HI
MNEVKIYCDGSSRGNGQEVMRAGAAALLVCGERMRAVGSYLGHMTNQQAEIVAACVGLEALRRPCAVTLHTDSKYVVETMNGNFKRGTNADFWSRLDLAASTHAVTYEWVKGNSGDRYQEGCDKLAKAISGMGEVSDTVLVEAVNRLQGRETPALVRAVLDGLRYLAGACDGARKRDSVGFNRFDSELGHRLAGKEELKPGELSAARTILRKYFGQLQDYDPSLIALI